MLIDTHTHMDHEYFDEDREAALQRALDNGVSTIINIGFNDETMTSTIALAEKYPFVYAAVGWHPQDAKDMTPAGLERVRQLAKHPKVVAIGEIGLDYYWDTSPKDVQHDVFRQQIRLAKQVGKPIVIHNRDAHEDVIRILREEGAAEVGGVMHCYSGSWETAQQCLAMNFYISFGGPVTFKNAKQPKEVLKQVPLDRLLIETDAPYLTPHPFRGQRNETSYVRLVAEEAANLKEMPLERLAAITSANARRLFRLPDEKESI